MPHIYFDSKANEWVNRDGKPVCQDHGQLMPCIHHGTAFKRHVNDVKARQHNVATCEWCISAR